MASRHYVADMEETPPGLTAASADLYRRLPVLMIYQDRGSKVRTLLAKACNQEIASYSRIGRAVSPWPFIGPASISNSSCGRSLPVSGVFVAVDTGFPAAANETCLAVKTFGVEAVSKKSIAEMIIFAKDKRYDVKGDVETETTIKSIKAADGVFRITETFSKHGRWLGFKRKTTYFLDVIDPKTIEIRDTTGMTRYIKCGSQRPPI